MNPIPVGQFANWLGGTAIGFAPNSVISTFALDSHSIKPGDLFLAIKGARVDGHDFVPQVLAAGAVGTVAERPVPGPHILVSNLVKALASMASHFRSEFDGPVIGITGSAGKTTSKEFVASAVSPLGPVLKTPGNRNSEFTCPLLWAELQPDHKAVVVEMAMRGFDQIKHLASFSRPSIGLVTNIGYAHMELVGSRHGIAVAKGELLDALPSYGTAVLWFEDDMLEWLRLWATSAVLTFGYEDGADCRITDYKAISWQSAVVKGTCLGRPWEAVMPAAGRHIALNAAAAVLVAASIGLDPAEAASHIHEAVLPPMRMEVIDRHGATILLDNYNASPPSMIAAIETLAELPVAGKRYAIIGEMRELGEYTESAHRQLGTILGDIDLDHVVFFGPSTGLTADQALKDGMCASKITMADSLREIREFLDKMQPGDAALIKGSRALELERSLEDEAQN